MIKNCIVLPTPAPNHWGIAGRIMRCGNGPQVLKISPLRSRQCYQIDQCWTLLTNLPQKEMWCLHFLIMTLSETLAGNRYRPVSHKKMRVLISSNYYYSSYLLRGQQRIYFVLLCL